MADLNADREIQKNHKKGLISLSGYSNSFLYLSRIRHYKFLFFFYKIYENMRIGWRKYTFPFTTRIGKVFEKYCLQF